ncbi:hypothetical protein EYC98_08155 [Halieaceae bacterium IMCC14734]|uniref:Peptidase M28 domain-containing protein n=1 Tax=Candidatus Litorirhabdus singularis TaxID=2518993 RepID=A0ABT3TEV0_9GAMM|nr:hypothetical protein [Candidatus Litorirhabdus singularis]MCX2980847.1 hypothetical protein [Candidatus Litorirhabdus singularis]
MNALADISFLPPEEYRAKVEAEKSKFIHPLGVKPVAQLLPEGNDARSDISADEIAGYLDYLTDISLQSKRDGELLWGRIQGTKYERQASNWVQSKMIEFGFTDVKKDRVPARRPLWRLDGLELTVTGAPGFSAGQTYRFNNALTAYQSATTPREGSEAELVYVGEGTAAELRGRDLAGKMVLLRSRGLPGALFHSARTAFSRIATGTYGEPAGVIMWSDVPNATQVAARVGSVGGGENIGLALPWTSINNDDGYYLRKLLDRASADQPVTVRLNVQGAEEAGDVRYSYNVYGTLPGRSGKYILYLAHVDGFLYAMHCNGGAVAMLLAMANHYAKVPMEERAHGMIFLFVGDHENPGVGATDKFIETNRQLVENDLLLVLRPEKPGMIQEVDEGWLTSMPSNVALPGQLMITNRSPLLIDLFRQAASNYAIATGDFFYTDPAADETNFHPPYLDKGIISAGWATATRYYHTTADGDQKLVSAKELEKMARAYAFIADALADYSKSDLEQGGVPYESENSIYQSDILKLMFGNH